ncbi:MAG: hypothetical protein JW728_03190 [Candidatus Aureabacteria bacterium]|nr:hypothetical protein [Candidatus Auribacterota bacterium]
MRRIVFALVLVLLVSGELCFAGDRCRKLQSEDSDGARSGGIKNKGNMTAKTYKGYAVANNSKSRKRMQQEITERRTLRRSMRDE